LQLIACDYNSSKMITKKRLKSLYYYANTGHFINIKTGKMSAGYKRKKDNRIILVLKENKKSKQLAYSRMIWLWHYGSLPLMIDHINGNPQDNRIENLRECSRSQNGANSLNRRKQYKGVHHRKDNGKYMARICINRKSIFLGNFNKAKDAAKAYDKKARALFGEFARTNF